MEEEIAHQHVRASTGITIEMLTRQAVCVTRYPCLQAA
jgi:hypothetical protein